MRGPLRWVHRTLGLFAAVYVLVASATGALLIFRHELLGLAHPELGGLPADPVGRAEQLAASLPSGSFTSIKLPTDALPAFIVHLPEHRTALYDPATLAQLDDRFGLNRALDWTFDLHHYLLAGETGMLISGAFGIAVTVLILIGLYLWWPWRRGWRLSHARPGRSTRSARLAGHTSLAVLMAPALFLAAVTGSAVIFHKQAHGALVAIFGAKDPEVEPPRAAGSLAAMTRRAFPDAVPRMLIVPKEPGDPYTLRLRQPGEVHPNGRSTLSWDPVTRQVVRATSEPESGAGPRIANLLYPLHIGTFGGLPLRLFLLLSAPLAFFAAWHGLRSILTRRN